VLAAIAAVLALVGGAGAWYVFGEERRLGRILAGVLSERLGVPITVEGASTDGERVRLRGVRLVTEPTSPVEIKIGRVDVTGDLLTVVAPAGRRVSIVAGATSITLRDTAAPRSSPTASEALRQATVALLKWPGTLTVRLQDGELTRRGRSFPLELSAEKTDAGLNVTLALLDAGTAALRMTSHSTAAVDGAVNTRVDFAGAPKRLEGVWPATLPVPDTLAGRADLTMAPGADTAIAVRITAGEAAAPVTLDATSRWDTVKGELAVSRYEMGWGDDVRLEGTAKIPTGDGILVTDARGTIDGSPLSGRASYDTSTTAFTTDVAIDRFDARRLARRWHATMPTEITAARLTVRATGSTSGSRPVVKAEYTARALASPALPRLPLDAAGAATLALASGRVAIVAIESATLDLSREGRGVGRFSASSRVRSLWPLDVRGDIDDASALASLLPVPAQLSGQASVAGELTNVSPLAFRGAVQAQLGNAQVTLGGPVTFQSVRATVPIGLGVEAAPAGTVTAERVSAYGFTATGLSSSARLSDGRLLLPDIRYAHYGGQGGGWIELAIDGRPTPLRARLEGERVDLTALVRSLGTSAANITGRIQYQLTAQYTGDRGLAADVRLTSHEGGGEVSIDAVERLLADATVQAETTGVLRQTLENLRVFRYESLEGELTWLNGAGHIDLSLKGKKRLGIFPGPVEAINVRNVPLTVLARTLTRGTIP